MSLEMREQEGESLRWVQRWKQVPNFACWPCYKKFGFYPKNTRNPLNNCK